MVTQIINSPESLVQEALDGLLTCNPNLARLDGYPDIKVVFNKAHDKSKQVALISGGGSGHEPAHAGYVGQGMLTAAVCGEVFASPSAEAVLAAIRTVTGPPGCLLIIKNYTGDRLHFGLAAEQAKAEGYKVEMVVVGEDVAIDTPGLAGRRGLAGTALVHKIAGAVAASGSSLPDVVAAAQQAADACATLGVALKVCTLPGKQPSNRLADGEIEIGLGIHGEPGHEKAAAMPAKPLAKRILTQLANSRFFKLQAAERVALMVNNLGATTPLELNCMAKEALTYLQSELKVTVERCLVGPFMTSLDMSGCSLTLMRVAPGSQGDVTLSHLDLPVGAPGWPHTSAVVAPPTVVPIPQGPTSSTGTTTSRPAELTPAGAALERAIKAAAEALVAQRDVLNSLDAKVGDGDCGDTMAHGGSAILSDLATKYPLNDAAATINSIALSIRHAVGGTSGAIYDIGLSAAARSLKECSNSTQPSVSDWAAALRTATDAIAKYGGAQAGSRTMLDALLPAAEALQQAAQQGLSGKDALSAMAAGAKSGAEATKDMVATAGRASYVPESELRQTQDPGATAVAFWMQALATAL